MTEHTSERYLKLAIEADAFEQRKIAFISGPRQVGKTTLARSFLENLQNYYSYDEEDFRRAWAKSPKAALSNRLVGSVVLDEIHKDRAWKRKLKGIYDSNPSDGPFIVTGSARLDLFRKGSDSLMGRYLPYRLHPFTLGECKKPPEPDEIFQKEFAQRFSIEDMLALGGFPEPLLKGSAQSAKRWSKLRLERLVYEDTRDISALSDFVAFGVLAELLPERVGSALSINNLREDVGRAYATVRAWYQILEVLYFSFTIRPYSKNIVRAIRQEPKMYLYDILRIPAASRAKRLENLTALHLLKACHYWTDCAFGEFALHYVRDKSKREVDFLITREAKPWMLVECKSGKTSPAAALLDFSKVLKPIYSIQLVDSPGVDKEFAESRIRIMSYDNFLSILP